MKNYSPVFSPPGKTSASNTMSPSVSDSKSFSETPANGSQSKNFRETTYIPPSPINTNREYLRYTVNLNKGDKNDLIQRMGPSTPQLRNAAIQLGRDKASMACQSPTTIDKSNSFLGKADSKAGSNLSEPKQVGVPKFLNKKVGETNKKQQGQSSRVVEIANQQKKIFVPKLNKSSLKQKQSKIVSSHSTCNLAKVADTPKAPEKKKKPSLVIEDFKKLKVIGEGNFGQVFLVIHNQTNSVYAIKQINKKMIAENKLEDQMLLQIKMLSYLNHPNILKLYGVLNSQHSVYLITEYMQQGNLYNLLRKNKILKQIQASKKLQDIIHGLYYLHNQNIAHRDIKPQNIVMSYDVCKICDLGWVAVCDQRRKTICGTIDYASPEILEGKDYGIAIDLWCLGVLSFQLMVGRCPFYHISRKQTMRKIMNADLSDLELPATITKEAKDFICRLLVKNPQDRMSAESALCHPLITKYKETGVEADRIK